jgi:hypothetical protein
MKTRTSPLRLTNVAALALIAGAASVATLPVAHAAPDCSASITLADWGENPAGYIDIAPGESCQFGIRMRGTVTSSEISQKPSYGKLKKIDAATYEYRAKAKYKGSDSFAIKATGTGPKSGTSIITMNATIK